MGCLGCFFFCGGFIVLGFRLCCVFLVVGVVVVLKGFRLFSVGKPRDWHQEDMVGEIH